MRPSARTGVAPRTGRPSRWLNAIPASCEARPRRRISEFGRRRRGDEPPLRGRIRPDDYGRDGADDAITPRTAPRYMVARSQSTSRSMLPSHTQHLAAERGTRVEVHVDVTALSATAADLPGHRERPAHAIEACGLVPDDERPDGSGSSSKRGARRANRRSGSRCRTTAAGFPIASERIPASRSHSATATDRTARVSVSRLQRRHRLIARRHDRSDHANPKARCSISRSPSGPVPRPRDRRHG